VASIIEIIIQGSDQSGPAFQSARQNVLALGQATTTAQTGLARIGQTTQVAAAQAGTGLARIEQRAEGAEAAIITLGIAGSTTATRMRSLGITIQTQEQALAVTARRLSEVRAAHDADSLAVDRAQLAYDRLNRTLANNRLRLQDLRTSGDVTGIKVIGAGAGGAAGAAGAAGAGLGARLAGGLSNAALGFGIGVGTEQIGQTILGALGQANAYARIDTTLRQLSGTQERYNEAILAARANQRLYGGTLDEQLTTISALIPFLRTTNAQLTTLDTTTKLLALRTPEQGTGGAAFALQEFLTAKGAEGSTSLAERFNLNRQQVTEIITQYAGDEQARLVALQALLAQQGVTTQALAAQAQGADAPFRQLSASWQNFLLREGQAAQTLFGGTATWIGGVLDLISAKDAAARSAALAQIGQGVERELGYGPGGQTIGVARVQPAGAVAVGRRVYQDPAAGRSGPALASQANIAPPSATIAPPAAPGGPQSVTNVTIHVAGSVTAERDLSEAVRRRLIGINRQNGINPVLP
jgi:hypothetical protein